MNKNILNNNLVKCAIVVFVITFMLLTIETLKIVCTSSPVEEYKEIKQPDKINIKLDTEIKLLDSIKNEKIIEVKNLDDDSTLILFYKLIGK